MSKSIGPIAAAVLVFTVAAVFAGDSTPIAPESIAEDLTPNVGSVEKGSRLLKATLHDKHGTAVGSVENIIIDPYYSQATALVIRPTSEIDRVRSLVVPMDLVAPFDGEKLKASVAAETIEESATSLTKQDSRPYTRTLSVATFRHYSLTPYWEKDERKATDRQDQFVMLTDLRKQAVRTPSGDVLGRISDVIISRKNGKVAYALFEHDHSDGDAKKSTRTFPIPLAAFVVPSDTFEWMLELPETILDNTELVTGDEVPKEVSRGWVEYIHVRYGGGVFDGVQRELKTVK